MNFDDLHYLLQLNQARALTLVSDLDEPYDVSMSIYRSDFDGKVLAEQKARVSAGPRSVGRVRVEQSVATPIDSTRELLWATTFGAPQWSFVADKDLNYPPPAFDADWDDGKLTIHAKSLLRDVCVFVDRLDPDATISEQLVTLMPGESFTFFIQSKRPLTREQLTSPPVFQCANRFGRRSP